MTTCSASTSGRESAAVGSSITISWAFLQSARRISTFCLSAVRSDPALTPPSRSNPTEAASSLYLRRSSRRFWKPAWLGSTPRKTFCSTVSASMIASSCAIRMTPLPIASRGEWNRTGSPRQQDLAVIGGVRARDDLAQGGLARPVLADEGVNRTSPDGQADALQGARAAEGLGDVPQLDMRALEVVSLSGTISPATPG